MSFEADEGVVRERSHLATPPSIPSYLSLPLSFISFPLSLTFLHHWFLFCVYERERERRKITNNYPSNDPGIRKQTLRQRSIITRVLMVEISVEYHIAQRFRQTGTRHSQPRSRLSTHLQQLHQRIAWPWKKTYTSRGGCQGGGGVSGGG